MNVHHLSETRNSKLEALKGLGATPDQAAFNALESEIRALDVQISNARRIEAFERAAPVDERFQTEVRGSYNLLKAVREAASGQLTGFEMEAHRELSAKDGKGEARGIWVPTSVLLETRVQTVADAASAGNTVFNQYGATVDRLRVQPVVQSLGATMLTGLEGNGDLILPRNVTGTTAAWAQNETDAIPQSDSTWDNITMHPRSVVAETRLSNALLLQNSVQLQNWLVNDLAANIALAIDKAAIAGTGLLGQPSGILTAVTQSATTETDWSKIVADLLGSIDVANDFATGILITTALQNALRKSAFDTTGQPIKISDLMHSYTPATTNQLATLTAIAGNWSSLMVGVWNSFSLLVDPYSLSSNRQLKLVAAADVDVAIRHPESFSWKTASGS